MMMEELLYDLIYTQSELTELSEAREYGDDFVETKLKRDTYKQAIIKEFEDLRRILTGYIGYCDLLQEAHVREYDTEEAIRHATEELLRFHAANSERACETEEQT